MSQDMLLCKHILVHAFQFILMFHYVGIAAALKQAMNDYTARDKKRGAHAQSLPYLVVIQPVDTSIISFFDKIKSRFLNSSVGRF